MLCKRKKSAWCKWGRLKVTSNERKPFKASKSLWHSQFFRISDVPSMKQFFVKKSFRGGKIPSFKWRHFQVTLKRKLFFFVCLTKRIGSTKKEKKKYVRPIRPFFKIAKNIKGYKLSNLRWSYIISIKTFFFLSNKSAFLQKNWKDLELNSKLSFLGHYIV